LLEQFFIWVLQLTSPDVQSRQLTVDEIPPLQSANAKQSMFDES